MTSGHIQFFVESDGYREILVRPARRTLPVSAMFVRR